MKKIELPSARHSISVLQLLARGIFPKAFGIILLTVAVQIGMLTWFLLNNPTEMCVEIFRETPIVWVARVGFVLILLVLTLQGCQSKGSKTGYTWRRLAIPEGGMTVLHGFYSLFVLICYWGALVAVILGTCTFLAEHRSTYFEGTQSIMIMLYQNYYTHNLLPLANGGRWALLALIAIALAVSIACYGVHQRRGQVALALPTAAIFSLLNLNSNVNTDKTLSCIVLLVLTIVCLFNVCARLREE